MKPNMTLKVMSLLNLLLLMIHMSQDVILQSEGSVQYPIPVAIFAVLLYASLMASEKAWGQIVLLLGGLFGTGMIVVHANGIAVRNGSGLFFVFVLFALSTTGWITIVTSARELANGIRARRAS